MQKPSLILSSSKSWLLKSKNQEVKSNVKPTKIGVINKVKNYKKGNLKTN